MLPRCVALLLALLLFSPTRLGAQEHSPSMAELAAQLDAARYQVRHRAQQALLARSLAELAPLRKLLSESPSSEVRAQLRRIFEAVEHRELVTAFERLAAGKSDDKIDLEEGLWLVTLLSDERPSRAEMTKELDALAALVRRRLPAGPSPPKQDPRKVMETLHSVLYAERKFRINFLDYNRPANCSALEVLRKNQGLPITLSLVAWCVGRRLELPIDGVATPGRYLVKYRAKPLAPFSEDDLFLDPLGEGRIGTAEEMAREFAIGERSQPEMASLLSAASHRETVRRMLTNLASAYSRQGDERRAARIETYLQIVGEEPSEMPPRR